jgi:hypothetical protein
MTRAEIYTLLTSTSGLLAGIQLDETIFENLLDIAQMQVEGMRPWIFLRSEDTTQTASPSDTFSTPKTLAASFSEWCEESPIELIDASNNAFFLTEVPFSERYKYRTSTGRFCVDYPNSLFYLLGNLTDAYTIKQSFIKLSTLVSSASTAQWIFPARFHKLLALTVAALWRHGVDYDIFNAAMADQQVKQAQQMLDIMTRWDSNLQYNMQRGKDPFNSNTIGGFPSGGSVSR